ncbi:unnamed protein product [Chondrus crispus]|uniref:Uncharacterized protein n=1 Tax=Chondrus crispus TaxID=2769 RepID=R7QNU7_CHOCR|nr:unnamed protein product [Chondrus crispus]CDF39448.1 unnamed protein product [Chondrus crispus]|eukprot:XP_005719359.1 unnamed protein product [Chondrus crispus]
MTLDVNAFHVLKTARDGRSSKCSACNSKEKKAAAAARRAPSPNAERQCRVCRAWKTVGHFRVDTTCRLGTESTFKSCQKAKEVVQRKEHKKRKCDSLGAGDHIETMKRRIHIVVTGARRRNLDVKPEHLETITGNPCSYCGRLQNPDLGVTVDRVDPSDGYVPENTAPACWPYNRAKGVHVVERFIWKMSLIAGYTKDGKTTDKDEDDLIEYGASIGLSHVRPVARDQQNWLITLTADEVDLWCFTCFFCGSSAFGIDRLTPGCHGGSFCTENAALCCWECNSSKGRRDAWSVL